MGLTGSLLGNELALMCLETTWVLFMMTASGGEWGRRNCRWAPFGPVAVVYQLGLSLLLLPWWGERRTVLIGLGVVAVEFAAYGLATQSWMIYAMMLTGGVGLLGDQAMQGLCHTTWVMICRALSAWPFCRELPALFLPPACSLTSTAPPRR